MHTKSRAWVSRATGPHQQQQVPGSHGRSPLAGLDALASLRGSSGGADGGMLDGSSSWVDGLLTRHGSMGERAGHAHRRPLALPRVRTRQQHVRVHTLCTRPRTCTTPTLAVGLCLPRISHCHTHTMPHTHTQSPRPSQWRRSTC